MCLWMKYYLSAVLVLCVGETVVAAEFPYRARVLTDQADVFSGPGDDFYVTQRLPQGTTVEVYRHDPGDWCAIRPPKESYSLVFARHVDRLDGRLGRINKESVPSRVGSPFTDLCDVVQVRLEKDELVEVLGEGVGGESTWLRVAPPAGEFRWIRADDLQPDRPTPEKIQPISSSKTADDSVATGSRAGWTASSSTDQSQETVQIAHEDAPPSGLVAVDPQRTSSGAATAPDTTGSLSASDPAQPASSQQPLNVSQNILATIEELELRLSQMVAQDRSNWQIDQLERDAERLLAQAVTIDERQAIKRTLEKIDRFAGIQRRMARTQQPATPTAAATIAPNTPVQPLSPSDPANAVPASAPRGSGSLLVKDPSQFDAIGVLRPVVSQRTNAPRYALVDGRGQILSFVTPKPDLNLQPYLGQRIGVIGTRQFLPEFQRSNITAGHVAPMLASDPDTLRR